ncbi:MAG: hypothetical protein AAFW70_20450, partial [Cyanobacteria bacterium J06635_10]
MYSEELLKLEDLQPFINQPETLINQTLEFQLQVANYLQTPRQLLEILANNSSHYLVVEAAKLHVNLAGEMVDNWQLVAENAIKNAPLAENDRLVAELLKIAPVPEYLISEWIPGNRLIEGLENPYLTKKDKIKLLERLAKSTIIEERLKAAAHPDTPRETLEILAGDLELPIRIAVKYRDDSLEDVIQVIENQHEIAANWETLPQQLVELAGSKWSWIRQAVARNFYTPVEVLRELVGDREEKIQFAVAFNLATPGNVLDLLVNHYYGEITETIAKHPNASEDALIKLLPQYNFCIYKRPNLPAGVLAELINYEEEKCDRYRRFIIENPNSPGSTLAKILDCDIAGERINIASHPNILVSSLEKLAQDSSLSVRLAVYQNPKTPENLRNQLLEEFLNFDKNQFLAKEYNNEITSEDIWKGIAESVNTSASVLERLADFVDLDSEANKRKNIAIREASCLQHIAIAISLIGNFNTPVSTREKLIQKLKSISNSQEEKFDWKIYLALAFNSAIPEEEREEYFQLIIDSGDYRGIEHLAFNRKTPPHILEDLAKHKNRCIYAIVQNSSTPIDVLCELSKHAYEYIHQDLAKNPSTPPEIISELAFSEEGIEAPRTYNNRTHKWVDWGLFWFEYPNMPIKELYRIQLAKEIEFEDSNAEVFIKTKFIEVPQFINYFTKNNGEVNYPIILASKKNTPIHILEKLVEEDDLSIRMTLAQRNENLNILLKLSRDS